MNTLVQNLLDTRRRVREYRFETPTRMSKQQEYWTDEPSQLRFTPTELLIQDIESYQEQHPLLVGCLLFSVKAGRYTPGHYNALPNPLGSLARDAHLLPKVVEGVREGRYL